MKRFMGIYIPWPALLGSGRLSDFFPIRVNSKNNIQLQ